MPIVATPAGQVNLRVWANDENRDGPGRGWHIELSMPGNSRNPYHVIISDPDNAGVYLSCVAEFARRYDIDFLRLDGLAWGISEEIRVQQPPIVLPYTSGNLNGSPATGQPQREPLRAVRLRDLRQQHPRLDPPAIHNLLRVGETMNVISTSKAGKSFLMADLAVSIAANLPWLGFDVVPGRVLIIDNELRHPTLVKRMERVADERQVSHDIIDENIDVFCGRGKGKDIYTIAELFEPYQPGELKMVILDALYRFLPKGCDENKNSDMMQVYNQIDAYAERLNCPVACVHHATKGNQSGKSVTDVGSGAGAQSRAVDTHLVLRPHQEDDAVVVEAAVRSWAPIEPRCLRWVYPCWHPADDLDPADLKPERAKAARRTPAADEPREPPPPPWTPERFANECVTDQPESRDAIIDRARRCDLSLAEANRLFSLAVGAERIHDWPVPGDGRRRHYARTVPPIEAADEEVF